jgi:hypothetical protein
MDRMAYCHDYSSLASFFEESGSLWVPEPAPNAARLPGHYGMTGAGDEPQKV